MRLILSMLIALLAFPAHAAEVRDITFPVSGEVTYRDDFGESRGSRLHEGVDLIGAKMTPLVAAVDGTVVFAPQTEPSWGYGVWIRDAEGYEYVYIHMNNDTPGTDDGNGGVKNAYAPGIKKGAKVEAGELIGWMGDSGNAEHAGAHLHFEIRNPSDVAINPYPSLQAAEGSRVGGFSPDTARATSPTINDDKQIVDRNSDLCAANALLKAPGHAAVYYCGADGKRYVFPHQNVYLSWYSNFEAVEVITPEELAAIPLGGNVTMRPGTSMVKITSDSRVYAVDSGGVLRWVPSQELAEDLYGPDWNTHIQDISDAFFVNYTLGDPVVFAE